MGEVLQYEISFAVLDEVVEVVDYIFVLHLFVELVLSLLLFMVLAHLYSYQFL